MSDTKQVEEPTKKKQDQAFTARGRPVEQSFFKGRAHKVRAPSDPVKGRNRANSFRRLEIPRLSQLTEIGDAVAKGAAREINIRKDLVQLSQKQHDDIPPLMASKGPIDLREASALRFSASLAEEAQDELNAKANKKQTVGLIGIANVDGTLGVGFSGRNEQEPFINRVQERMLEIQQHYQEAKTTEDWSAELMPVATPQVIDDGNVCAASRANAAARAAKNEFENMTPVPRSELPTPDTLVEMTTRATHPTGARLKKYETEPLGGDYAANYQTKPMYARNRNGSVSNMANSCQHCIAERAKHLKK